jgi:hypothetical protein
MLRVLRITLMWLIALAVPIQGSAAVTMFGCGPGHQGGIGSSPAAMADEHAQDTDHHSHGAVAEDGKSHHHDGHMALDHSHSPTAQGAVHKVAQGNCTPCASCCVVAALPATMIQFEPVPLVDFFVVSIQIGVTSFLADGLERPPRSFLA